MGYDTKLNLLEICIIDAVKLNLSDEARPIFENQVREIKKIQRLNRGKEINLYSAPYDRRDQDDVVSFPNAESQALLATLTLFYSWFNSKLAVEVWLVSGRLFSLLFNNVPTHVSKDIYSLKPRNIEVKVWLDPMICASAAERGDFNAANLRGWLRSWWEKGKVATARPALALDMRRKFLEQVNATLPVDYLEFILQCNGARLGDCQILGLDQILKVVLYSSNYYVIAEFEGHGALAVREGDNDAKIYFLDYEEESTKVMGPSLEHAVTALLGRC